MDAPGSSRDGGDLPGGIPYTASGQAYTCLFSGTAGGIRHAAADRERPT
jgi:hypothetical protein